MRLVLFIPDFVLADEIGVLRSCPVRIAAERCQSIGAAVERCRLVAAEAPALQPFRICADKDPSRQGLEAIPEAIALGFLDGRRLGESRLEVCAPTSNGPQGTSDPIDTIVFTDTAYQGAVAGNELREAFFHHQKLTHAADLRRVRHQPLYGLLINLRLAPAGKPACRENASNLDSEVGVEDNQFEFAVGLPLYDAAGLIIDLRRYSVFGGLGRDGLKPAAELLKQLAASA
jgi:hypothetical protein